MELGLNLGLGTGGGLRLPSGAVSFIRNLGGVLTDIKGVSSRPNQLRQSMYFDGATSWVNLGAAVVYQGNFSIPINFIVTDLATRRTLVGGDTTTTESIVRIESGGTLVHVAIGGTVYAFGNIKPVVDVVSTLTITRVGNQTTLNLNGTTQTLTTSTADVTFRYVGKWAISSHQFKGYIWFDTDRFPVSFATKTGVASAVCFDRSGTGNHATVVTADVDTFCHETVVFGNNTLELDGYTEDITTYPITALIPLLFDKSADCLGNTPTYTGRAKYTPTVISGTGWNDWVLAWPLTGELYDADDGTLYTAGVPNEIPAAGRELWLGPQFFSGPKEIILIYQTDLVGADVTKVQRYVGIVL